MNELFSPSGLASQALLYPHGQTIPYGCFIQSEIEGFHSRDLYTKVNYFEGVATQENNNSDNKRLLA